MKFDRTHPGLWGLPCLVFALLVWAGRCSRLLRAAGPGAHGWHVTGEGSPRPSSLGLVVRGHSAGGGHASSDVHSISVGRTDWGGHASGGGHAAGGGLVAGGGRAAGGSAADGADAVDGSAAGSASSASAAVGAGATRGSGERASAFQKQLDSLTAALLAGDKVTIHNITLLAKKQLDVHEAIERLQGKLPADVIALARVAENASSTRKGARGRQEPQLSEEDLEKARLFLNGMVEQAVADLDKVLIECGEFKDKNRGTFKQVGNDMKRIAAQLSDLGRKEIGAQGTIKEKDRLHEQAVDEKQGKKLECDTISASKVVDLKQKEEDLAVFSFILDVIRCKDAPALAQLQAGPVNMSICTTQYEGVELRFSDPSKQAEFKRLMTTGARQVLSRLLGKAVVEKDGFLEMRARGEATSQINTTTMASPTASVAITPVQEDPSPEDQWKKCTNGEPDCGMLHDTMSIQWGEYRDVIDELKHEIAVEKMQCKELQDNLNEQINVISTGKTRAMEMMAEVISNGQAETQAQVEKTEEYHELEGALVTELEECKARVNDILFTNICAVKKVRDELMSHSEVSPPDKIDDCDVEEWSAGACSVDCDDTCPQPDPKKCGGWQTLERRVMTQPNEYGIACPALSMQKHCNQFKCPVDCSLSEWSGWAACSADCGGGEQQRTRSVLTKPMNGGQECDTTVETRPCHTGSCDRDCVLAEWSEWSPCSMACGGGVQERARAVEVAIRGAGKCPTKDHPDRLEEKSCNSAECIGDEICVAKQDLVIAIDGSGSMSEEGFDILRALAANISGRYHSQYYGDEAMRIGVVLFGQGQAEKDGTVTKAKLVQALTDDIAAVIAKIEGLTWQKGITNMAQALLLAEGMFREGGRTHAQSAVLILTDGKPSLKFVTSQEVQKLKDTNTKIFMAPIAESSSKDTDLLKTWASQPWETNYERIPGLTVLKANVGDFSHKLVTKFCPNAFSPSQQMQKEELRQFMLLKENGHPDEACAAPTLSGFVDTLDACADAALTQGFPAFNYYASGSSKGMCFGLGMEVTNTLWDTWSKDRTNPACPNGQWVESPFTNTYVHHPDNMAAPNWTV